MSDDTSSLLSAPEKNAKHEELTRAHSTYHPLPDFDLARNEGYQQQYGDIYFLRLAQLKLVCEAAAEVWRDYEIAGDTVKHVDRVLDVRQGEFCWIVGTVYLDMVLKPNILDDISKDHWIAAPPPREKYTAPDGSDQVMLEDESGRLRLTGAALHEQMLVTGCIIAVMGTENANGDFEVVDIKLPGLPSQPERWALEKASQRREQKNGTKDALQGNKIALISGLELTGSDGDTLALDLLTEYLLGEAASPTLQKSAAGISRLIILGNSLSESAPLPSHDDTSASTSSKKPGAATAKKYGYDASAYNPAPTAHLDAFLSTLLPSMPITLLPGASDPANVSMPQQPLHPALFPHSRAYTDPPLPPTSTTTITTTTSQKPKPKKPTPTHPLHPSTNPTLTSVGGHLTLLTSGQPTADISKYLPSSRAFFDLSTLDLMALTLHWRLIAPTAPDTLWCYPYQDRDPFVIAEGRGPRLYCVGNVGGGFGTRVVRGAGEGQDVRCVAVPLFRKTGQMVVVDLEADDMPVEVVSFGLWDPS